jgi:ribosomal protein S18 acetylase RimI-like enzyme
VRIEDPPAASCSPASGGIPRKVFSSIDHSLTHPAASCGECARYCGSKDNIKAYLKRNPGMSFVARSKNAIIAAVLCGHDGRRGYLHHLAVHPDFRNQGIGGALVERCILVLQSIGIQKCHLFIFHNNRDAIRFWEKIGWS